MNNQTEVDTDTMKLDDIDFSQTSLSLGAKLPRGDEQWTPLDRDDWAILAGLIRARIPLQQPNGHVETVCAADESRALKGLALYAEAVVRWYAK